MADTGPTYREKNRTTADITAFNSPHRGEREPCDLPFGEGGSIAGRSGKEMMSDARLAAWLQAAVEGAQEVFQPQRQRMCISLRLEFGLSELLAAEIKVQWLPPCG